MTDAHGNVVPLPGTSSVAEVSPAEILASTVGLFQKGRTILGGQGLIAAGTVMARQTATKKYVVYNDGGSGGAEVAKGVLRQAVDTGTAAAGTSKDRAGNIIFAGILKDSELTGLDANGVADLNGRQDTDADLFIF